MTHTARMIKRPAGKLSDERGTMEKTFRYRDVASACTMANILIKKVADSNYLQKADEALTKVLIEKAAGNTRP
jgi:hypothetical protein